MNNAGGGDKMGIFRRKDRKNQTNTTYTMQEINSYFENSEILSAFGNSDLTSATFYACMQIRCNSLAKIPFKIFKQTGDGSEEINHNLTELLKLRPNTYTTAHDFKWATEYMRLFYGNAFWVYDFVGGKVKALYLLNSPQVEIMVDDTCLLGEKNAVYYIYTDEKQGQIVYPSDKIVHFKNFAKNGIKGTPVSKYLRDVIDQEKSGQRLIKERYKNGLQDPIIVTYIGDLDEARKAKIQKKFAEMGGTQNGGKVIPIPSDFDVKTLETKLVNNQFFQMNGLTTRHIANAFGIKSFQLNDMEKSTYSNIEQQNKAFYSDTMQNVLTEYEQEMTYKLLSTADKNKKIYIEGNADVMLRSDLASRYSAYQIGISSGFLKVSEARKRENLPYVDGTDKLIIGNGASIPFEQLGNQYAKGGE